MKVLKEVWRLWTNWGDCEDSRQDFDNAKDAYKAAVKAVEDNSFNWLERHTIVDESDIVEVLHKAGMLDE